MSDEYVKDEQILETRWKCPTCEKVNRGRDMKCSNCSSPKDESSEYEVDENGEEIVDSAQVAEAEAGEHWTCAYCEKENRGLKRVCAFCGADQTTKARKNADVPPPLPKKKQSTLQGCLVVLAFVVGVALLLYFLSRPDHVKATVASLEWEQAVHLQKKTLMHREDWKDKVPADATDRSCERRQRTTRDVVDHYRTVTRTRSVRYQSGSHEVCRTQTTNMKNGYAKRQQVCHAEPEYSSRTETYTDQDPVYRTEPVYDEFCRFDLFEWPVVQTAKRTGTTSLGMTWPEDSEAMAGVESETCVPCDEVKSHADATLCCGREAHYRVHFQNPK
jgi:hypothetical protein